MNDNDTKRDAIYCNPGAWTSFDSKLKEIQPSSIFILTDTNTRRLCLPLFLEKSNLAQPYTVLEMPAGEENKTISSCQELWLALSNKGADRSSVLINLGGGVVTDLGGFVASTFKRGISFMNIPTSLLAMVDASVGGKNGVDLGSLKNQVGVIRDADAVVIDTFFLQSLPKEELVSGYAEMLKHGLIHSEIYWNALQHFFEASESEKTALIWESVCIKKEVVDEDPTEQHRRKTLNYGHTLGHAIESFCLEHPNRVPLLHGEAIAIGMILATYISAQLLNFPQHKLKQVVTTINQHFPKQSFSKAEIDEIIKLLVFDKKNKNGIVYFVLLSDFGDWKTNQTVSNDLIYSAFDYYKMC